MLGLIDIHILSANQFIFISQLFTQKEKNKIHTRRHTICFAWRTVCFFFASIDKILCVCLSNIIVQKIHFNQFIWNFSRRHLHLVKHATCSCSCWFSCKFWPIKKLSCITSLAILPLHRFVENDFIHRITSYDETPCPWVIWLNCCKNNDNEMIYNKIDTFALLLAHPRCMAAGCSPKNTQKMKKRKKREMNKWKQKLIWKSFSVFFFDLMEMKLFENVNYFSWSIVATITLDIIAVWSTFKNKQHKKKLKIKKTLTKW